MVGLGVGINVEAFVGVVVGVVVGEGVFCIGNEVGNDVGSDEADAVDGDVVDGIFVLGVGGSVSMNDVGLCVGLLVNISMRAGEEGPEVGGTKSSSCTGLRDSFGPSHRANKTPVKSPPKAIQLSVMQITKCRLVTNNPFGDGKATGNSFVSIVREQSSRTKEALGITTGGVLVVK